MKLKQITFDQLSTLKAAAPPPRYRGEQFKALLLPEPSVDYCVENNIVLTAIVARDGLAWSVCCEVLM
jgi:hypothetical protein